jgi:hypothetical protein
MYDTGKIYDNVIQHQTLKDGTVLLMPPDGFGIGYHNVNRETIVLTDGYREKKKRNTYRHWQFTITKDGVSLHVYQKSIDTDLVLAIAGSYNRLMKLIEPYESRW